MRHTETGATVVLAMKRHRRKSGQALIEYAFLLVLLSTVAIAVIIMAGTQLTTIYSDVSYEFTHLTDSATLAPDGVTTVAPGGSPAASCPAGETLQLRGHKWKCKK
jgi:Flp pilus assembly pilin Flp